MLMASGHFPQARTVNPSPELSAQATAANIPAFVASDPGSTPSRESLLNLFPAVSRTAILKVVRFDFHPLNLYKLDVTALEKAADLHLNIIEIKDGQVMIRARTGSSKDYPTFASLLDPLLVYFDILGVYAASSGNNANTLAILRGSNAHYAHLLALNRTYTFSAILQYHIQFFLWRSREMAEGNFSGWATSNGQLMNQYLFGHVRSFAPSSGPGNTSNPKATGSSSSSTRPPVSLQICFPFNRSTYTGDKCSAGRIHRCSECDSTGHKYIVEVGIECRR